MAGYLFPLPNALSQFLLLSDKKKIPIVNSLQFIHNSTHIRLSPPRIFCYFCHRLRFIVIPASLWAIIFGEYI